MSYDLATGILLGLSAGLAPGPLLALALSETLRRGLGAGLKVSLAPLVTDAPIAIAALLLLANLPGRGAVLAAISFVGAGFLVWLGVRCIGVGGLKGEAEERLGSLRKAILVNLFSPHPYLFWLTVAGPRTVLAAERGALNASLFVGGFYAMLVGATMALAVLASRSRRILGGGGYLWAMRILGAALIVLAGLLARDGYRLLTRGAPASPPVSVRLTSGANGIRRPSLPVRGSRSSPGEAAERARWPSPGWIPG